MNLSGYSSNATQLSQPPKPLSPLTHPTPTQTHFPNPNGKPSIHRKKLLLRRNDQSPVDPTVSWTSSIARRCRNGQLTEAALEFTRMRINNVKPNHVTFVTLLSACADFPSETLCFGSSIHAYVRKLGLDRNNVVLATAIVDLYSKGARMDLALQMFDEMYVRNAVSWNTMINGYMRNGMVEDAINLFNQMPQKDKISWTALIGGFVRKGLFEEALEQFREMQLAGIEPDYVTILCVLSACANLGSIGVGLWVHRYVLQKDFGENIRLSNSLIDMYSRCGCIEFARQEFEKMPMRSLVSWNSIIIGLAVNGHSEDVLQHFEMMQREGFKPDGVSFTGALTACSHAGLVDEGLRLYDTMKKIHRIIPRIEHYGCLVDLLSRAGRLEDALHIIESMPMKPNEVVLGSLLAACRTHGDVNLAERLTDYLVELEPDCDSNYVLLSNIYAAVGRWDGVGKVRNAMKALGIKKKPGFSAIEIECRIHEFVAGDKSHTQSDSIYAMLNQLFIELKLCGYVPETSVGRLSEYD
ncbi:pentatricopeptide repeat-containing protein At1g05750, chloroplastic [Telopea speciosissima]|uniref:pentatricopeptide repeat-containing protein At1g05750, chloroplastic n=1 Tax=Telopea speciosissima TaxID=54955 RepID=UPI001CC74B34|nr:pentatricopeptide repeat-containing protein At1g05750, chloroplastic [Telopea speciosissima]